MSRARKVCSHPGCAELQPCPEHERKPWSDSHRRGHTLSGSAQQRRATAVMNIHSGICHVCGFPGSDQVDHVVCLAEDGPDTMANLRPIHAEPCHREKTQAEAQRARGLA